MPHVMTITAALGLLAASLFSTPSASAAVPPKGCTRPPCTRAPGGPGGSLLPGVQGPQAADDHAADDQGPASQNQNDQQQNGNNPGGNPNQPQGNDQEQNQQGNNQNRNQNNNQAQNQNNNQAQNQNNNQAQNQNNNQAQNQDNNQQQNQQTQNQQQNQNLPQQAQDQNQNETQQPQQAQIENDGTQNQNQPVVEAVAIPVGSRITLPGDYGAQPGAVYLVLGGVKLPMVVEQWDESGITLKLPNLQITEEQQVKLEIAPANGEVATLDIALNPMPKIVVHDESIVVPTQTADVAPDAPQPRG